MLDGCLSIGPFLKAYSGKQMRPSGFFLILRNQGRFILSDFPAWYIFYGHSDHFHGFLGHGNTRHSIGHQTSFNLIFFYSWKKLHWFTRYRDILIKHRFWG